MTAQAEGRAAIQQRTLRQDRWWLYPLVNVVGLGLFVAYGTYIAFANSNYWAKPYISPFYSPCFTNNCADDVYPHFVPWVKGLSPALLILWFPMFLRATCYYYRKAYYRSFWLSPPACAVAEPHRRYSGERQFPLILQNSHRYWFYSTVVVAGFLTYDAVAAFSFPSGPGVGVGTVVLVVNAVLIWGYLGGCHSCRHVLAGRLNHFSRHPLRYRLWTFAGRLNAKHQEWAWASMIWIALADVYIRLVAAGVLSDPHWVA